MEKLLDKVLGTTENIAILLLMGIVFVLASVIVFLYQKIEKNNLEIKEILKKMGTMEGQLGKLEGKAEIAQVVEKQYTVIISLLSNNNNARNSGN